MNDDKHRCDTAKILKKELDALIKKSTPPPPPKPNWDDPSVQIIDEDGEKRLALVRCMRHNFRSAADRTLDVRTGEPEVVRSAVYDARRWRGV